MTTATLSFQPRRTVLTLQSGVEQELWASVYAAATAAGEADPASAADTAVVALRARGPEEQSRKRLDEQGDEAITVELVGVRAFNVLERHDVLTIRKLAETNVYAFYNLGKTTAYSLHNMLLDRGITPLWSPKWKKPPRAPRRRPAWG